MQEGECLRPGVGGGAGIAGANAPGACILCGCSQVEKMDSLADWQLYFAEWGYSTVAEKAAAEADPRITVIRSAAELQRLAGVPG